MARSLVALLLVVVAAVAAAGAVAAEDAGDTPVEVGAAAPVTPVLSARRVPGLLAAPVADRRLVAALDSLMATQPGAACLTVASAGRTLYSLNPDTPFVPASLEKLLTAVAALEVLGPEFRFVTEVVAAAPPDGSGVVAGDVWFVGAGDANLATADYAARFRNQPQVVTPLESLADAIAGAGVRSVTGRVVGDESRYDTDRYPDTWPERFVTQDQSGPLSALTVNDGWVAFPPHAETTVPDEEPAPDPAAHGAGVLASLLTALGVTVGAPPGVGPAPEGAVVVASVESPPLSEIVADLLGESDNQTAELLVKEIAVARGRPGTTRDGVAVVAEVVTGLGLPAAGISPTDGSGLAAENRASCALVQAILDGAGPDSTIDAGLAVAGRTGTLSRRFVDSVVTGRLRAKTGTLNEVTALAGFVSTVPGGEVAFTYIANLVPPDRVDEADLAFQDTLATVLAAYPEGPPLDQLSPVPVG